MQAKVVALVLRIIARLRHRQKERHVLDGKRMHQPVANRAQHFIQIRLRSQFAREFDQRPPIVVAVLIEEVTVQLFLQPVADRLKDEGGEQDQPDDGGRAQIFGAGEREDQSVENPEHHQRSQRVNVALLENDVDVHQPVAQNRVSPRQRHQDQRQHRHLLVMPGKRSEQIWHGVDQGERHDAQQRAVAHVLQLPPHQRIFGVRGLHRQNHGAGQVENAQQEHPDPVQEPIDFHRRRRHPQHPLGYQDINRQQYRAGT